MTIKTSTIGLIAGPLAIIASLIFVLITWPEVDFGRSVVGRIAIVTDTSAKTHFENYLHGFYASTIALVLGIIIFLIGLSENIKEKG